MKCYRNLKKFYQVSNLSTKTRGKYGRSSISESALKRPVLFEEKRQEAHCSSRSQKSKVYGTHKPCKNKYNKGSMKPFLYNIYRGLVTPSYKKTRIEAKHAGHRRK